MGRPRKRPGQSPTSPRGDALRALAEGTKDPRTLALLDEAARIADRLAVLDVALANSGLLRLVENFDAGDDERRVLEVRVSNALSEARQQAAVLRQLLVTLGVTPLKGKRTGGTILEQLAASREGGAAASGPAPPGVDV